jgi:hypothetical protein
VKTLAILAAASVALALVSCSETPSPGRPAAERTSVKPAPAPPPAAPVETRPAAEKPAPVAVAEKAPPPPPAPPPVKKENAPPAPRPVEAVTAAPSPVHPDTRGWDDLFAADLGNATFPKGVWRLEDGVLTASQDRGIWTKKVYDNFVLDLEFKTAPGTNSGVIVYCSNVKRWIPNSIEIQIADDHSKKWSSKSKTWQCGAIFGRLAAKKSVVKKPGEWNRYTITCRDHMITVALNGEMVTEMDMRLWTDRRKNPDGSSIPGWLSKPAANLPTRGHIGLQGKHAGAPIFFRNLKIRELPKTE